MEHIQRAMERLATEPAARRPAPPEPIAPKPAGPDDAAPADTAPANPAARQATDPEPAARPDISKPPRPASSATGAYVYSRTKVAKTPHWRAARSRLITATGDPRASSIQVLRTQVLQVCRTRGWRTIGVTSVHSGAGKSFTAANLAISIAHEPNQTVLLADVDMHNPQIDKLFGYRAKHGFGDCLLETHSVEDVLFNPGIDGLVVLPAAERQRSISEMLASKSARGLFRELGTRYRDRMVICDMPPLMAADTVLVCLPYLDAVVLVVEFGRTSTADVEQALEVLDDTPIAAVVLNKVQQVSKSDAYYGYGDD